MPELPQCADEIITDTDRLARFTPDGATAFRLLIASIEKRGLTSPVSRALLGASLAVASSCEACARRQARNAARAGAERDEFKLAVERGVLMAAAPAAIVAAEALRDFDAAARTSRATRSQLDRFVRMRHRKGSREKPVEPLIENAEERPPYACLMQ